MRDLIELLIAECDYRPRVETVEELLSYSTTIELQTGEAVIRSGQVDPNIYIVETGIIRYSDFDGGRERTYAFGLPGSMFESKFSFIKNLPSYYDIIACCPTILRKILKKDYDYMIETNFDFTRWQAKMAFTELFMQEYKNSAINNGSARERFKAMLDMRPEIIHNVPQRIIASYLNVSPEYLCRMKKSFLKGKRTGRMS